MRSNAPALTDAILTETCHDNARRVLPRGGPRLTRTLRRRQIRFSRRRPKLPSLRSFDWMGGLPFHRSFGLRGVLRSLGFSRRRDFLTESQSYRQSPLY